MGNKKQTAVEWLVRKLSTELIGEMPLHRWDEIRDVVQHALQMEKEQMKDAVLSQCTINHGLRKIFENQFEQYYKETYGGKNE